MLATTRCLDSKCEQPSAEVLGSANPQEQRCLDSKCKLPSAELKCNYQNAESPVTRPCGLKRCWMCTFSPSAMACAADGCLHREPGTWWK